MTEETAVRLLKTGDPAGLATLVALYQARAIRVAVLITRDPHLAEDAVAEAFLTAFRRIETFDSQRPFGPWFCQIVANTALKILAARRREVPLATGDGRSERGPQAIPADLAPVEAVAWVSQVEDRETIRWAMRSLPPKQRAAIALKYFAELDEGEIARALGVPRGTVKSRLFNGLARLRVLLDQLRPA